MQQQLTKISIPDGIDFADLKLTRDADGHVSFDWTPITRICEASGVAPELFRDGPEDNVAGLIVTWYRHHIDAGGTPDATAEDLLSEVRIEDAAGQGFSLQPGRA